MAVKPIPEGFHTVTPHLVVGNSVEAIDLYERAFGAKKVVCWPGPDGQSTMHAEVAIGDSRVMLTDENPQWGMKSPKSLGGAAVGIHLFVEDCDALYAQAVAAGMEGVMPPDDAFWGDRYSKLRDPWGHEWAIATHTRDLTEEEIQAGMQEMMQQMSQGPPESCA